MTGFKAIGRSLLGVIEHAELSDRQKLNLMRAYVLSDDRGVLPASELPSEDVKAFMTCGLMAGWTYRATRYVQLCDHDAHVPHRHRRGKGVHPRPDSHHVSLWSADPETNGRPTGDQRETNGRPTGDQANVAFRLETTVTDKLISREERIAIEWANWWNESFSHKKVMTPKGRNKGLVALVKTLLNEGYTIDEMKAVAVAMGRRWIGDPEMERHHAPATLLRPSNFRRYLTHAHTEPSREKRAAGGEQKQKSWLEELDRGNDDDEKSEYRPGRAAVAV